MNDLYTVFIFRAFKSIFFTYFSKFNNKFLFYPKRVTVFLFKKRNIFQKILTNPASISLFLVTWLVNASLRIVFPSSKFNFYSFLMSPFLTKHALFTVALTESFLLNLLSFGFLKKFTGLC